MSSKPIKKSSRFAKMDTKNKARRIGEKATTVHKIAKKVKAKAAEKVEKKAKAPKPVPKKILHKAIKTPAKKAAPKSKPAPKPVKRPIKKAAPAKKPAHPKIAKKILPVKKAAPAKKGMPAKKAALIKKATPVKKAAPAKKILPAKKAIPAKKPGVKEKKPAAPKLFAKPKEQGPKVKKPKMILPECKITLGFAGMPVSAKAHTIQETIVYAHNMGLKALEIQLTHGTEIEDDEAQSIKVLAEQAGVRLTVHAPYYTSLAEDEQTIKSSIETIKRGIVYASKVGAEMLVFHPGFFISAPRGEAFKRAYKNIQKLIRFRNSKKRDVLLGIENAGSEDLIGDLDEVITVCKNEKGVAPVLDLAHYHARTNGSLKDVADFEALFEKLKPLKLKEYYMHMSGMIHKDGKEVNHVPIKKSDLNYTAFAEFLLKKGADVTLISDSPVLEYDAVTMRTQLNLMREKLTGISIEETKPPAFGAFGGKNKAGSNNYSHAKSGGDSSEFKSHPALK